jgi:hypothetical protein
MALFILFIVAVLAESVLDASIFAWNSREASVCRIFNEWLSHRVIVVALRIESNEERVSMISVACSWSKSPKVLRSIS